MDRFRRGFAKRSYYHSKLLEIHLVVLAEHDEIVITGALYFLYRVGYIAVHVHGTAVSAHEDDVTTFFTAVSQRGKIEVLDRFSMEDCDGMSGDELDWIVTWKGKGDLSALKGKQVAVRFHMARATLFSFAL